MQLACVTLSDGLWAVCWLCAAVPSWLCAGGGLGDLLQRPWVPREGGGNGQAFAQRAAPGLALGQSALQPAGFPASRSVGFQLPVCKAQCGSSISQLSHPLYGFLTGKKD